MNISDILLKMIADSKGNRHDIDHFLRVWSYSKTIGELEKLDGETQFILEAAAIVHDIACPLCRQKYGSTAAPLQEAEGIPLAVNFFSESGLPGGSIARIAYLVGHHHTLTDIDGMDYQILLEADYIANASESNYAEDAVKKAKTELFRTVSGKKLLDAVLLNKES